MRFAPQPSLGLASMAALLLSGCGQSADTALSVVAIGTEGSPFESGARLTPAAQLVRAASVEGLVGFDEQGRVVPSLAERWIVHDDGQSYIFRLRDGVWQDGTPITPQSVRAALMTALAKLRGTPLGLDLAGADDIRVMAARVIEIRLAQPMPDLLQLLAQPELGLRQGKQWTGTMRLQREGQLAVLTPIAPEKRGLPAVKGWGERMRPLRLAALPGGKALERFNQGDADVVLGGRIETLPLAASIGLARGTVKADPVIGLLGLAVMRADGFLEAPENREALALAIDREALIGPFGLSGWVASTRMVPAGVGGDAAVSSERWADLTVAQRRELASRRVAQWRAGKGGSEAIQLRVILPDGPGSDTLFGRLREDLAAIGVELLRSPSEAGADLRLVDTVARYSGPVWFLNQFNCRVQRGLCSERADALATAARSAVDPAERTRLLSEAEAELTRANVYIPFGAPVRWSLVRGTVTGFAANRWSIHPLMPMADRPK